MTPQPHASDRSLRMLFVFASLDETADEVVRLLAHHLDAARLRLDVIACFQAEVGPRYRMHRLEALGIDVDTTPYNLSFEDTVAYLARKLIGYELVVSAQNVADIYPAMERLKLRPPLIEWGCTVSEAQAGPKHLTARYVGVTAAVREAAASRMHAAHAVHIPRTWDPSETTAYEACQGAERVRQCTGSALPVSDGAVATQWLELIESALEDVSKPPPPSLLKSFQMGGFECSTHRLRTGRRLDLIGSIAHDLHVEADYRQLKDHGIRTIRDGVRWHLIEPKPGVFDFSSLTPMIRAADRTGVQIIWDLLHYGWPDDVDIWAPSFVDRFTRFASAVGRHVAVASTAVPYWCPINEISYLSWAGGDVAYMNPFACHRGFELKCQLVRATIAAIHQLRGIDARARFVQCEPGVAVHHDIARGHSRRDAEHYHDRQYQACDLLEGTLWPQLGGDPSCLDIIGVNYYVYNQRIYEGEQIDVDHERYRPLSDILYETYARYGRPLVVSETGTEGVRRADWYRYISKEVARARDRGVPVEGICLYPIANHPGWDDDRLCPNGLLSHHVVDGIREVYSPLAEALAPPTARQ